MWRQGQDPILKPFSDTVVVVADVERAKSWQQTNSSLEKWQTWNWRAFTQSTYFAYFWETLKNLSVHCKHSLGELYFWPKNPKEGGQFENNWEKILFAFFSISAPSLSFQTHPMMTLLLPCVYGCYRYFRRIKTIKARTSQIQQIWTWSPYYDQREMIMTWSTIFWRGLLVL